MRYNDKGEYQVGGCSFNPADKLIRVKGSRQPDYLEVKWRMVMLREMYPDARHHTEIVYHDAEKQLVVVRAVIELPPLQLGTIGASAVGHKTETAKDFPDYIEKAETGATGRALYAAGIGAQYSNVDYNYEDDSPKEFKGVDSPLPNGTERKKTTKEDLRKQLAIEVARIGSDKVQNRAMELFKVNQSSLLTNEQLDQLLIWCTTQ